MPGEYAKKPVPIKLFVAYGVKFKELRKEFLLMTNQNVFIQVIHKPRRKVIVKRGIKADNYFDYCGEVGRDVWGTLLSMDSLCGEPVCLWLPEQYSLRRGFMNLGIKKSVLNHCINDQVRRWSE